MDKDFIEMSFNAGATLLKQLIIVVFVIGAAVGAAVTFLF